MKFKDFKYCIIVDSKGKPMTWSPSDEQLCYCNDEFWRDYIFPLEIVTIKEARKQIRKTKENRKLWGYALSEYKLIPVKR